MFILLRYKIEKIYTQLLLETITILILISIIKNFKNYS